MGKITEEEAKEFQNNLNEKSSEAIGIVFKGVFKWVGGWVNTVRDNLQTEREAKRRWEEVGKWEFLKRCQEEQEAKARRKEAENERIRQKLLAEWKEETRRKNLKHMKEVCFRVMKFLLVVLLIAGAIIGGLYFYKML